MNFWQATLAVALGYMLGYLTMLGGSNLIAWASHQWYHWRTGKPHIDDDEYRAAIQEFVLNFDPSSADPEAESESYQFCRKCRKIKKNFVGEGRKRLCMDCTFGDDNE